MSTFGSGTFGSGTFGTLVDDFIDPITMINPKTLQPFLGATVPWTEAELNYADEEPPAFFPDNQDSNWGFMRKLFSDQMQIVADQLQMLSTERFVPNAEVLLPEWELEMGLPVASTGRTTQQRRDEILNRIRVGPFTEERRKSVIEAYFTPSFGTPIQLLPGGVDLSVNPQLFGEASGAVSTLYRVYQNIPTFSYEVFIKSTVTPDTTAMARELTRITPAGISYVINNTQLEILDYAKQIRHDRALAHWRLGTVLTDAGPYGYNLVASGSPAVLAAPGLLVAPADKGNGGHTFSSGSQILTVASAPLIDKIRKITMEVWVKPAAFATTNWNMAYSSSTSAIGVWDGFPSAVIQTNFGQVLIGLSGIRLPLNTKAYLVATYDGDTIKLYLNGVEISSIDAISGSYVVEFGSKIIGGSPSTSAWGWNGSLDEVAIYDYALSPEQIQMHYSTGLNIV